MKEMQGMNSSINNSSQMSLHGLQIPNSHLHHHQIQSNFDQPDEFYDQMLPTFPSCSWPHDSSLQNPNPDSNSLYSDPNLQSDSRLSYQHFDDSSLLAVKHRRHQISGGSENPEAMTKSAIAMMMQQQMMMSRGAVNGVNGTGRSPSSEGSGNGESGLIPMPLSLNNGGGDLVETSLNEAVDGSVHGLMSGFNGSLHGSGIVSNQSQHFLNTQNFGAPANGSTGGGSASAQPRQRIRARRGQATDPHSIAERLRRERIAERMKALQELVPNANKTDKASMLDEIIDYVKFLQLQVKVLSMSRLGGAPTVSRRIAVDISSQGGGECVQTNGEGRETGRSNDGTRDASAKDNISVTEHQVIKLMEQDMGSAMQYLQGKGLCLMPISLATAISTATCHSRTNLTSSATNGGEGPSSPNLSALTVQSTTCVSNGVKDSASISTP